MSLVTSVRPSVCLSVRPSVRLSVGLSVRPHISAGLPLEKFRRNLLLATFVKICRGKTNVVKEGQKYRALYMMLTQCTLKFLYRRKKNVYIYIYICTHTHTQQSTIITVEVYSAQNVLKDTIQVRNSGMSGKSASIACHVKGVRE